MCAVLRSPSGALPARLPTTGQEPAAVLCELRRSTCPPRLGLLPNQTLALTYVRCRSLVTDSRTCCANVTCVPPFLLDDF